jgi:hypothetical protein
MSLDLRNSGVAISPSPGSDPAAPREAADASLRGVPPFATHTLLCSGGLRHCRESGSFPALFMTWRPELLRLSYRQGGFVLRKYQCIKGRGQKKAEFSTHLLAHY